MLISCPKCKSVYNISAVKLPAEGKKFKCAECGNVWLVVPQDNMIDDKKAVDTYADQNYEQKDTAQISDNDINVMFKRFSNSTKELFASEDAVEYMSWHQKIWHYLVNSINPSLIIAVLLPLIIFLGSLIIYINRYAITEHLPNAEKIYANFHLQSVVYGKNIIFKDVVIQNPENQYKDGFEIYGKLYNRGTKASKLLPVKATVYDNNNKIEKEIIENMPDRFLDGQYSSIFRIKTGELSPNADRIILSFETIK